VRERKGVVQHGKRGVVAEIKNQKKTREGPFEMGRGSCKVLRGNEREEKK